jgi:hypothetical protein
MLFHFQKRPRIVLNHPSPLHLGVGGVNRIAQQGKSRQIKPAGMGGGRVQQARKGAESVEVIVVVLLMRVVAAMDLPGDYQAGSRLIKVNHSQTRKGDLTRFERIKIS